jgi:pimeloyl-ACP methyl ester carboxylesterase
MRHVARFLTIAIFFASLAIGGGEHAMATGSLTGEPSEAKLDGHRVNYVTLGNGREALVFVHGWMCNLNFWSRQAPAFAARSRVLAIDLPGHGKSDKSDVAYTMDLFARALDAVLRDAGVDRAVLVGHSMGTPVIREFYRKYPQKTLALVIVDGPLRAFGDKKMMEQLIAPLRGPGYKDAASSFIDSMFGPDSTPELRKEVKGAMLSTPQSVAISAMEGMADESIWKEDKIDVPTLAIMAKSAFLPADAEQSYRGIAPNLDYQMWEGVGHFLMMEKPREFNEALAGFLKKNGLLKKLRASER